MDKKADNKKKDEHKIVKSELEEDKKRPRRKSHNMPGQYEGRGPQENTAIGYDALDDI